MQKDYGDSQHEAFQENNMTTRHIPAQRTGEKARAKVAEEQRKIADQRRDFHHKLSRAIADNYAAFICEDLAVTNVMKKPPSGKVNRVCRLVTVFNDGAV